MADKKISQLSSASTPLAGTEVLPIVQSGSTVKVASDDLTVKNVRSNATSGILQVTGPAAAATRTMTVPDANFTAARTDAGQTFSGTQTFSTINTSAGYQFRGADNTAYETLRYVGGTNNPGLFTSVVEASKKVRLNATGSVAAGHELCLGAEGTQDVFKVGAANVTVSTGNLIFGGTAQRITGDMSNATVANRMAFQTSTTNGNTTVNFLPNGTATVAQFFAHNNSDPTNASNGGIVATSTAIRVSSGQTGSGTYLPLALYTNGAEQVTVGTDSNVTVKSGNLVVGTAAKGIDFSANTHAAGMTSELLNWYEEGTWTPTFTSGITSPTYSTQNGAYTRVGRIVYFMFRLELSAGTGAAAILQIGGLPFTVSGAFRGGAACFAYAAGTIVSSTSTNLPTINCNAGSATMSFYKTDGVAFNGSDLATAANFSADISGWYFV